MAGPSPVCHRLQAWFAVLGPTVVVIASGGACDGADFAGASPESGPAQSEADVARTSEQDGERPATGAAGPTSVWRDATAELGLPDGLMGATASIGDVEGDGVLDLLVGGHSDQIGGLTELYRGVDGAAFEAANLLAIVSGDPLLDGVLSTSIVDLDGDGLAELLLGAYQGGVIQVLWNDGAAGFEVQTVYLSPSHPGAKVASLEVADLDGDGQLDLYASMKFPSSSIQAWDVTHPNVLLRGLGGRAFDDVTAQWPSLEGCAARQTFAAVHIPGASPSAVSRLYLANDLSEDCVFDVTEPATGAVTPTAGSWDALDPAFHSMGLDWAFEPDGDGVLVVSTNVGFNHLVHLGVTAADVRDRLPDPGADWFGWGAAFVDADNDGDEDLVWAAGLAYSDPTALAISSGYFRHGDIAEDGRLFYWERQPDGTFTEASADAGAGGLFAPGSGEWYGLAAADLNADGCVDLVATPREILQHFPKGVVAAEAWSPTGDAFDYEGPGARALLNSCPRPDHAWVGFRVPDVPGLVVALTRADGSVLRRAVKGLVGVGSRSGGGQIHFGLGDAAPGATEATLLGLEGQVLATLDAPTPGAYHALGGGGR